MTRPARIVVGEGRTAQQGLLRFVLEGEGFEVVGEARGTADLTGVIEANDPDVVVLDDGIGVMAVSMVHEVAPKAKVVLVWPSAVVPIGGDARVEPAKILRDLGPAVTHVLAPAAALTESFERPDWIDKVRKDPATLRDKLGNSKARTKRPSVTHLQRRTKRLHPTGRRSDPAARDLREEDVPAPVVVLPVGTEGADLEPVLDIGGGTTEFVDEPVDERSDWNRRLGTLALSGAAAVSALVLALALGGGRVPVSGLRGDGDSAFPVGVPGFVQGGQVGQGPFGFDSPGGRGSDPTDVGGEDGNPGQEEPGVGVVEGDLGGDLGGDLATPGGSDGTDEPTPGEDPGTDDGTGGNDDGTGGGNDGGGDGGGNGGGKDKDKKGGGNGGGGGNGPDDGMPGHSADHNPHGGPPGQMGTTPAHGPGLGAGVASQHHHKH